MEAQKGLKEEESVKRFDFTKAELEYILENANFNQIQEDVFKRLTSKQRKAINCKNKYGRKYINGNC